MSKEKISISEIVDLMAARDNFSKKQTEEFVKMLLSTIEDVLIEGETVKIKDFGMFKPQWNEPKKSVDENTGEEVLTPGYYKAVFVPEEELKMMINRPLAHLQPKLAEELKNDKEIIGTKQQSEEKVKEKPQSVSDAVKTTIEPIRVFEEQAIQIKNLLSEITALSVKKGLENEEETIKPQPEKVTLDDVVEIESPSEYMIEDSEYEVSDDDAQEPTEENFEKQEEQEEQEQEEHLLLDEEKNDVIVEDESKDEETAHSEHAEDETETESESRPGKEIVQESILQPEDIEIEMLKERKKKEKEERKQLKREEIQQYFAQNEFDVVREIHHREEEKTTGFPKDFSEEIISEKEAAIIEDTEPKLETANQDEVSDTSSEETDNVQEQVLEEEIPETKTSESVDAIIEEENKEEEKETASDETVHVEDTPLITEKEEIPPAEIETVVERATETENVESSDVQSSENNAVAEVEDENLSQSILEKDTADTPEIASTIDNDNSDSKPIEEVRVENNEQAASEQQLISTETAVKSDVSDAETKTHDEIQQEIQKRKILEGSNSPADENPDYTFTRVDRKNRRVWWLILIPLLILAATFGVWKSMPFLKPYWDSYFNKQKNSVEVSTNIPPQATIVVPKTRSDSDSTKMKKTADSENIFEKERDYKEFTASRVIKQGVTLKSLAKEYLGNDAFWIYIYEANIETIEDPKNVALGTVVRIPKMDSLLINVNNPKCIQYANKLSAEYLYYDSK